MLTRLRSFYHLISIGQGFPALTFPKQLQSIHSIEVCLPRPLILGPILLITMAIMRIA